MRRLTVMARGLALATGLIVALVQGGALAHPAHRHEREDHDERERASHEQRGSVSHQEVVGRQPGIPELRGLSAGKRRSVSDLGGGLAAQPEPLRSA